MEPVRNIVKSAEEKLNFGRQNVSKLMLQTKRFSVGLTLRINYVGTWEIFLLKYVEWGFKRGRQI